MTPHALIPSGTRRTASPCTTAASPRRWSSRWSRVACSTRHLRRRAKLRRQAVRFTPSSRTGSGARETKAADGTYRRRAPERLGPRRWSRAHMRMRASRHRWSSPSTTWRIRDVFPKDARSILTKDDFTVDGVEFYGEGMNYKTGSSPPPTSSRPSRTRTRRIRPPSTTFTATRQRAPREGCHWASAGGVDYGVWRPELRTRASPPATTRAPRTRCAAKAQLKGIGAQARRADRRRREPRRAPEGDGPRRGDRPLRGNDYRVVIAPVPVITGLMKKQSAADKSHGNAVCGGRQVGTCHSRAPTSCSFEPATDAVSRYPRAALRRLCRSLHATDGLVDTIVDCDAEARDRHWLPLRRRDGRRSGLRQRAPSAAY